MISAIHGMNDPSLTTVSLHNRAPQPVHAVRPLPDEPQHPQQAGWQGESRSPSLRSQQGAALYQTVETMQSAERNINVQDIEYLGCAPLRPVARPSGGEPRRAISPATVTEAAPEEETE